MRDFTAMSGPGSVSIVGQIDMSVTPELRRALDTARHEPGCTVEVDLSLVSFMDSSGINELMRVHQEGHPVVISGMSDTVRRTLELLGLDQVFVLSS